MVPHLSSSTSNPETNLDPEIYMAPSYRGVRVQGSGFWVQGSGFRVQGLGFRVQGFGT